MHIIPAAPTSASLPRQVVGAESATGKPEPRKPEAGAAGFKYTALCTHASKKAPAILHAAASACRGAVVLLARAVRSVAMHERYGVSLCRR